MPLLNLGEIQNQVRNDFPEEVIQDIASRAEAVLNRYLGDASAERSQLFVNEKGNLYLPRPILEVDSIYESYTNAEDPTLSTLLVENTDYRVYKDIGVVSKITSSFSTLLGYASPHWLKEVYITWTPVDDTLERKQVLVDILRVHIERQAMARENSGGYYFIAPDDWELEIMKIAKRLFPFPSRR